MPLYDFFCRDCDLEFEDFVSHADLIGGNVCCPHCNSAISVHWKPTAAAIRTSDSATYLDGTHRPGMKEAKLSYEIESKMYELPVEARGDAQKEINRLRAVSAN